MKRMSRHTPGPWEAITPRTRTIIKSGPNNEIVCVLESGARQADIRLIEVAPKMLELLQESRLFINNLYFHFQQGGKAGQGGSVHQHIREFIDNSDVNALLAEID